MLDLFHATIQQMWPTITAALTIALIADVVIGCTLGVGIVAALLRRWRMKRKPSHGNGSEA